MRTIAPILLFLFAFTSASPQSLHIDKTKFVVGGNCANEAMDAIVTPNNEIVFTGLTGCNGVGDIPIDTIDSTTGQVNKNVVIGKLDVNLNLKWIRIYGGTYNDVGEKILATSDGGFAVLAYTQSNDKDVVGNHGYKTSDIWLIKTDSIGNKLWSKCYGGPAYEEPYSFAITPDKGFIILGITNGVGGDVPFTYSSSPFVNDWFVIKTDSVGNKQWTNVYGGTNDEYTNGGGIFVTTNGYFLASASNSRDHDCTSSWNSGTDFDWYLLKLDTAGNVLWHKSYGGSGIDQVANAMWDNRDSSILITGFTTSNDHDVIGFHGTYDIWTIKLDTNGNIKWAKALGGPQQEYGWNLCAMPNKGYLVSGIASPGTIGNDDVWLFALDSSGNTTTNKMFGGTNYETNHIIIPYQNSYCAAGGSRSTEFTEGLNIGSIAAPGQGMYFSVIDFWPLMVENKNEKKELKIFPNPSKKKLKIILPNQDKGKVRIINSIGHLEYCQTITVPNNEFDIDLSNLIKGSYIVEWYSENGFVLRNILVIE